MVEVGNASISCQNIDTVRDGPLECVRDSEQNVDGVSNVTKTKFSQTLCLQILHCRDFKQDLNMLGLENPLLIK